MVISAQQASHRPGASLLLLAGRPARPYACSYWQAVKQIHVVTCCMLEAGAKSGRLAAGVCYGGRAYAMTALAGPPATAGVTHPARPASRPANSKAGKAAIMIMLLAMLAYAVISKYAI